jgi:AraC-like DNA-binding protein
VKKPVLRVVAQAGGKPLLDATASTGSKRAPAESIEPARAPAASTEPFATAHDAVYTLIRILLNKGVSAAIISQNTGIAADSLNDPDARVPLSQFIRLWEFACRELRNPGLALELHDRYPENRMHFVAHLGMRCATMREAIEQWSKYAFLVAETDAVSYEISAGQARFLYSCRDARYAARWFAEHYMVLGLFYARTFTGEPLKLTKATFMHADPGYAEIYARTFEAPVEFGVAENSLVFDAAFLDLPFKTADPYLRHFLVAKADELMARLEPEARIENRVIQVLSVLQAKGESLTLERVASALQMPVRRVRLSLAAEGSSFREALNKFRREAAARYLQQGLTVSQTAYLLGFSEPSALQHAFKRWYNTSAGSFQNAEAPGKPPTGLKHLRSVARKQS